MNVKYFADTDTLYIELYPAEVDETRDLDEDTLLEMDAAGRLCALTIEHASARMAIPAFSYEQIPSGPFLRLIRCLAESGPARCAGRPLDSGFRRNDE